ncbi:hypothetical protein [Pantoea sp. 1.19]|uniref:hypothetical protein n=1 Tax=Pantoea sp. 1.19 TaxID=1925589 RepID=UPI0009490573|nr:hypothetical protein [Pantoea sp. 1.19]
MRILLLLLLLFSSSALHATDWLGWKKVGAATLTWGPFTLYDSQLFTPQGRYQADQWPLALVITYRREIARDDLLEATRDQWQAQGIADAAQRERWLQALTPVWPDVTPGARLAFHASDSGGQFWWQAARPGARWQSIGPRFDPAFRDAFLAIWLSPRTEYPQERRSLIGG